MNNTNGALLTLVSGNFRKTCELNELSDLKFNTKYDIACNCDIVWIDAIKIPINVMDNIDFIKISIGESIIWKIPFKLLISLSTKKQYGNHYIIEIPLEMCLPENDGLILLWTAGILQNKKFNVEVCTFDNDPDHGYSLFNKLWYHESESRRKLIQTKQSHNIITFHQESVESGKRKISFKTIPTKFCAGFFIQYENASNIGLKFGYNGTNIISYNDEMVRHYYEEIYSNWTNDHYFEIFLLKKYYGLSNDIMNEIMKHIDTKALYWIPFVAGKKWNDKILFDETIDFYRCNNITLSLNNNSEANVYFLYYNVLKYESNMDEIYIGLNETD